MCFICGRILRAEKGRHNADPEQASGGESGAYKCEISSDNGYMNRFQESIYPAG
jgi:hypothetical protein